MEEKESEKESEKEGKKQETQRIYLATFYLSHK